MQKRHTDRKRYFKEQGITTEKYVIPYISDILPINKETRVLEIGCGEGGNLVPFLSIGCDVTGIDLSEGKIALAKEYIEEAAPQAKVSLLLQDIYEADLEALGQFDLIFMRDVIEHIHDQEKFMGFVKQLLRSEGKIFFAFPPWQMPFGGHQQICASKLLSLMPFYHLLPTWLYKMFLKAFGESAGTIDSLLEIKETGISIERFNSIVLKQGYVFDKKDLFFINPNYEIKFGLKPSYLSPVLGNIPYVRNFFATCCYAVISKA